MLGIITFNDRSMTFFTPKETPSFKIKNTKNRIKIKAQINLLILIIITSPNKLYEYFGFNIIIFNGVRVLKSNRKEKLNKQFSLLPSVNFGESKIIINSNKEIIIEGCKNILEYEDDRIKLNLGNKTLLIIGESLSITSITINGVVIMGNISSLEF